MPKKWYAVSTEWFSRPKLNTVTSTVAHFSEEIASLVVDCNGGKVSAPCFGLARKKDLVVMSTLFGILRRALQGKTTKECRVIASLQFSAIRDVVNSLPITAMAGRSKIPANLLKTPPSLPKDMNPKVKAGCSIGTNLAPERDLAKPFEDLNKIEKTQLESQLKIKRMGAFTIECLAVLEEELAPCPSTLGKAFGYGLLLKRKTIAKASHLNIGTRKVDRKFPLELFRKAAGLGSSPQSSLAVLPIAIANCEESKGTSNNLAELDGLAQEQNVIKKRPEEITTMNTTKTVPKLHALAALPSISADNMTPVDCACKTHQLSEKLAIDVITNEYMAFSDGVSNLLH
ncbi:hypothetical protein ACROYT_G003935 [Oculina patagonica]